MALAFAAMLDPHATIGRKRFTWIALALLSPLACSSSSSEEPSHGEVPAECSAGERWDGARCVGPCSDEADNDGDGWIDAADPDCAAGSLEQGLGNTPCNDGSDNDGDGLADDADPECTAATDDEMLGAGGCVDVCYLDERRTTDGAVCELWDESENKWVPFVDGPGRLRNNSRAYNMWIRKWLTPAGGLSKARFKDASWQELAHYYGVGDSAIWTGTYLASQVFRYQASSEPDAMREIERVVRLLHAWWNIPLSPGALARYAAPTDSAPEVLALFREEDPHHHFDRSYEGKQWNWIGHISRDQYQGVVLGLSLAYDVLDDAELKEMIREDMVELVEQLLATETRATHIEVNGVPMTVDLDYRFAVFIEDELVDGKPSIIIDSNNTDDTELSGVQEFMPNPSVLLRQIPGLSWLPDVPRAGSAIMLMSFVAVALHVTEGIPEYQSRRSAIEATFEAEFSEWLEVAKQWEYLKECGESYYGIHIAYQPAFNFARLEKTPARQEQFRREVLFERLWAEVAEHKDVFFAYATASQAPQGVDFSPIIDAHNHQMMLFPRAPRARLPVDNTGLVAENPECPGLAAEALDLDMRPAEGYTWQLHPWLLKSPDRSTWVEMGVDYEMAYWMGRAYGYLAEDEPGLCLRWRAP